MTSRSRRRRVRTSQRNRTGTRPGFSRSLPRRRIARRTETRSSLRPRRFLVPAVRHRRSPDRGPRPALRAPPRCRTQTCRAKARRWRPEIGCSRRPLRASRRRRALTTRPSCPHCAQSRRARRSSPTSGICASGARRASRRVRNRRSRTPASSSSGASSVRRETSRSALE